MKCQRFSWVFLQFSYGFLWFSYGSSYGFHRRHSPARRVTRAAPRTPSCGASSARCRGALFGAARPRRRGVGWCGSAGNTFRRRNGSPLRMVTPKSDVYVFINQLSSEIGKYMEIYLYSLVYKANENDISPTKTIVKLELFARTSPERWIVNGGTTLGWWDGRDFQDEDRAKRLTLGDFANGHSKNIGIWWYIWHIWYIWLYMDTQRTLDNDNPP